MTGMGQGQLTGEQEYGTAAQQKLLGTTFILHTLRNQNSKSDPTVPFPHSILRNNMDGQEKKMESFLKSIRSPFLKGSVSERKRVIRQLPGLLSNITSSAEGKCQSEKGRMIRKRKPLERGNIQDLPSGGMSPW